jgi:hypothetical protein
MVSKLVGEYSNLPDKDFVTIYSRPLTFKDLKLDGKRDI